MRVWGLGLGNPTCDLVISYFANLKLMLLTMAAQECLVMCLPGTQRKGCQGACEVQIANSIVGLEMAMNLKFRF